MSNLSKVNMSLPQGYQLTQELATTTNSTTTVKDQVTNPSVVVIGWIPTMGDGNTLQSGQVFATNARANPINVALARYYAQIRKANSSLSAYSASDIGKVLLALESLYGLLAENQIDIVSLQDYRKDKMAFRGLLASALWNNPNTAASNIANLIERHNNMCDKLKALPFIPNIPFLKEHMDWGTKVYKDDNCDKSSILLFRRSGYYYWEVDANDPDPGFLMLRDKNLNTYSYTYIEYAMSAENRMDIIDYLIKQYLLDDDMLNIAAEIYKAFGYDPDAYAVPKLPSKGEMPSLSLEYDLDIVDSLRNADFCELSSDVSIYGIGEDANGHLVYARGNASNTTNLFAVHAVASTANGHTTMDTGNTRTIVSYDDEPDDIAMEVITRHVHQYRDLHASDNASYVYGLRTEFLTGVRVYAYNPGVQNQIEILSAPMWIVSASALNVFDTYRMLTPLTAVPNIHILSITGNGEWNGTAYHIRKDIDNLGFIDNSWLSQLSQNIMLDKFNVGSSMSKK